MEGSEGGKWGIYVIPSTIKLIFNILKKKLLKKIKKKNTEKGNN